jgi:hypothetical protein
MGYYLQAFICRQPDESILKNTFDTAVSVDLGQELALIPMTEELFDQINSLSTSPSVDKFEYMTENVEQKVLDAIGNRRLAYVEAEYFGGKGGQIAIIWCDNRREQLLSFGQNKINEVLKGFGVTANEGQDEFVTLGFGLRRNTREWIDKRRPQLGIG